MNYGNNHYQLLTPTIAASSNEYIYSTSVSDEPKPKYRRTASSDISIQTKNFNTEADHNTGNELLDTNLPSLEKDSFVSSTDKALNTDSDQNLDASDQTNIVISNKNSINQVVEDLNELDLQML